MAVLWCMQFEPLRLDILVLLVTRTGAANLAQGRDITNANLWTVFIEHLCSYGNKDLQRK